MEDLMRLGWGLGAGLAALGAAAMLWPVDCPSESSAVLPHSGAEPSREGRQLHPTRQVPPELRWDELAGEEDATNRFPFTVIVMAHFAGGGERNRACSGVLIGPRLVLTAGNCVCVRPHPSALEGQDLTSTDASTCETSATVKTFTYEPPTLGEGMESWSESYEGTIRPHPRLKLLFDPHGNIISVQANLAVILLDRPVKKNTPPALVAEEGVRADELLTVVGYGYVEAITGLDGKRRFSEEQVLKISDASTGQARFGQPAMHGYKGDTGGPCLRETARGPVLVGISHRGFGEEATLTSLNVYQDWLSEEIKHAQALGSSAPQAPLPQGGAAP
jgi:hypothetical protein